MTFVLTITNQGQVTIPSMARKIIGVKKNQKLIGTITNNHLVLEPAFDFRQLRGSVKTQIKVDLNKIREQRYADLVAKHL